MIALLEMLRRSTGRMRVSAWWEEPLTSWPNPVECSNPNGTCRQLLNFRDMVITMKKPEMAVWHKGDPFTVFWQFCALNILIDCLVAWMV